MKKLLMVLIISSLFIVGCSREESTVVSNEEQVKNQNAVNEDTQDKIDDNSKTNVANKDEEKDNSVVKDDSTTKKDDSNSTSKDEPETKPTPNKDTNYNLEAENIRKNYEQKALESQDIKSTTSGIAKYNDILIETLRSYKIDNVESAKVVDELSEGLLTDIYGFYKTNWDETSFNGLREEQRVWVNKKVSTENSLSNNQLLKYQTLSKMVLDRCEVLNSYYNNNIFSEN